MVDINIHKAELERMLTELTAELATIGIHDPKNPSDWVAIPESVGAPETDMDLIADTVEDWDERRALVATLETRYNTLVRALAKIDAGTFGTCEICGAPIEEDRLHANPAARTDKEHMNDEGTLSL
jgi:RNA polymerase-binding transcription factor DksA